jgi:hypothetical protein
MEAHFDIDTAAVASPFGLMVSPEVVLQRMERSDQLAGLRKRVLRPLDAPWLDRTAGSKNGRTSEMALADAEIDGEDDRPVTWN